MQTEQISLSIIIPIFNEEGSITILYSRIKEVLITLGRKNEIIFVDDGSTDTSKNILKDLAAADKSVKVFTFESNKGQAKALEKGFREAQGDIIVTIDGDLQNDPAYIPKLISKLEEGYDLVCGWRSPRLDSGPKILKSKIGNYILSKAMSAKLHDMSCTLRAYRKNILQGLVLKDRHEIGFIPYILSRRTSKITEVKVRHNKRIAGKSKYNFLSTMLGTIRCHLRFVIYGKDNFH